MAILGRRWAASAAAFLSFSAMVLIWHVWAFNIQLQPAPWPFRSFTQSDDELHHLFKNLQNSSWFSSSTICKEFLLEGAAEDPIANVGSRQPGMLEWERGEWFNPPEALNDAWVLGQTFLRSGRGLRDAAFSATPDASIEVEWGSLTDLVRTLGGRLVLRDFWNGDMGGVDLGYQDLKLLLHGAFVSTGVDRRVCMTGCAFRMDYPSERDCEFVLKMRYPNRPSLASSRVEAELSSARRPGDSLHFPALRILGSGALRGSEYEFRSEKFLQTALNMSSSSNLDNNGNASPDDLVSFFESHGAVYTVQVAPTPSKQSQIREHGKVVVGPFSTSYFPSQDGAFLSTIELVLSFRSVVTRLTTTGRRVLVSATMAVLLAVDYSDHRAPFTGEQTPFNVEGIWDPSSEELCMIGGREGEIFPWKLCLKGVLRKRVSIDSPLEAATLSGPDFAPLGLQRRAVESHYLYRYTVAAKAEELARRATSPEFEALGDTRWFRPRFPGPSDVPGVCRATENLCSTLSRFGTRVLHDADGKVMDLFLDRFEVTFVESCVQRNFGGSWDAPLKAPVAGSYLRVAVRLSLVRRMEYLANSSPWQCHAEGVYESFTGKMHLVVHQRPSERIDGVTLQLVSAPWPLERSGGGGVQAAGDSEIYMQLQFSSVDRTMSTAEEEALEPSPAYSYQGGYIHQFKVNMWVESLRSESDPLYFKPLVAKNYPHLKPSP